MHSATRRKDARPVIIDTDVAFDDWMAMLYLLRHPDVETKAITVTGAGEAHCQPGARNALDVLALAGQANIPVARGRERPLCCEHAFPNAVREAVDALLGISIPHNPNPPSDKNAVELLRHVIHNSPRKVTILALGPLTNLAEALQVDSSLLNNVEMIYIMGGAVDVRGNLLEPGADTGNQVAEWNIYCDPHAARVVFESGAPITLVPLDATNQAPLTVDFYRRLEADRETAEAQFVYEVLSRTQEWINAGLCYFWDPLAAAILTDESLAEFELRTLTVVVDEGPFSGQTRAVSDGNLIRVCTRVNAARFEQMFLDGINGRIRHNPI